jgi:hypothetical protein
MVKAVRLVELMDEWDGAEPLLGDLVHINIFGQHIIFVNSVEIARNLFEKRSSIYSDRIYSPMVHDL